MEKRRFAGLDIGSTCAKSVIHEILGNPYQGIGIQNWCRYDLLAAPQDDTARRKLARFFCEEGITHVGVTGAGADEFKLYVDREFIRLEAVVLPGDPVGRELASQVAEVRVQLMEAETFPDGKSMLVSVGSGVSFTRMDAHGHQPYFLGSPVGGKMVSGITGVYGEELNAYQDLSPHTDLLMKERFPHLDGNMIGEFVLACFGNAQGKADVPTALKTVATITTMMLMMIGRDPEYKWDGEVIFIGTLAERNDCLRHWLASYLNGLGIKHRFMENGAHVGALGALRFARETTGT